MMTMNIFNAGFAILLCGLGILGLKSRKAIFCLMGLGGLVMLVAPFPDQLKAAAKMVLSVLATIQGWLVNPVFWIALIIGVSTTIIAVRPILLERFKLRKDLDGEIRRAAGLERDVEYEQKQVKEVTSMLEEQKDINRLLAARDELREGLDQERKLWPFIDEQIRITVPYADDAASGLRSAWYGWEHAVEKIEGGIALAKLGGVTEEGEAIPYDGVSPLPFEGTGLAPSRAVQFREMYRRHLVYEAQAAATLARIEGELRQLAEA